MFEIGDKVKIKYEIEIFPKVYDVGMKEFLGKEFKVTHYIKENDQYILEDNLFLWHEDLLEKVDNKIYLCKGELQYINNILISHYYKITHIERRTFKEHDNKYDERKLYFIYTDMEGNECEDSGPILVKHYFNELEIGKRYTLEQLGMPKSKKEIQKEYKYADVMPIRQFIKEVEAGCLNSDDGDGELHDGQNNTNIDCFEIEKINKLSEALEFMEKYPYVLWYNK